MDRGGEALRLEPSAVLVLLSSRIGMGAKWPPGQGGGGGGHSISHDSICT